jgi:hypothetical protein
MRAVKREVELLRHSVSEIRKYHKEKKEAKRERNKSKVVVLDEHRKPK